MAVSQTETKDVVGVLKRKVIIPPSQPATLISEDKRKLIGGVWRVKGETMKIPQLGTVRAKFNEAVAFGLFGIGLTGYHAFSVSTDVPSHLSHVVTLQIQDGPNNYVTFQDGTYISLEEVPWELPNGTEFYSIPDFGASPLIYFLKTVEVRPVNVFMVFPCLCLSMHT